MRSPLGRDYKRKVTLVTSYFHLLSRLVTIRERRSHEFVKRYLWEQYYNQTSLVRLHWLPPRTNVRKHRWLVIPNPPFLSVSSNVRPVVQFLLTLEKDIGQCRWGFTVVTKLLVGETLTNRVWARLECSRSRKKELVRRPDPGSQL